MNDKAQKDWHSAFAGGLSLSLKAYQNDIEIQREVPLSKTPPKMDALVIKKNHDIVIDNAIGRAFRKHNVVGLRGDERMCQALRALMRDEIDREVNIGRKEGIGIGRKEGIGIGRKELIADMLRNGKSPQDIADFSGIPIEQILEVKNSMLVTR